MTTPSSGPISMADINAEFGLGYSLSAYRGVRWFREDNTRGYFDGAGGNFAPTDFGEFYGKRASIPVTPVSNQPQANNSTFVVPFYNSITVIVVGGSGGQAGSWGINGCSGNVPTPSGGGGSGGASSFGGFLSSSGGAGGGGNAGGGAPGQTRTIVLDANANAVFIDGVIQNGVLPPTRGTSIACTVGGGGSGGGGGPIFALIQTGNTGFPNYTPIYGCFPIGSAAAGAAGASGSITLSLA